MTPALELTTTRILGAPPQKVWNAFTDPAHIANWWGPDGFSVTIGKMDFRTGGEWNFIMHGPDGTDYANHKVFLEISPPSRLVMLHNGHPRHTMTVTFEPYEAGTLLTLHHRFADPAEYDTAIRQHGAAEGARQTLNRFAEFLSTF
jgi:uncharacterized protein YndB with AHSA1/START domain